MQHRSSSFYALVLLIVISSCARNKEANLTRHLPIPQETRKLQEHVIKHLSGEATVSLREASYHLDSRWSPLERRISRSFLADALSQMGVEPQQHHYQHPNVNFGIDLILVPFKGTNLYGVLPSSEPSEEYVIIGGHYDTAGDDMPGALDNGTGIALALGVLHEASKLTSRSKNVMIVFFDQEEEELVGSSAFAKHIKKQGLKVHSVHNFDLIGWDSDGNNEVELELPEDFILKLYQKHATILNIPVYENNASSSDHYSFIKQGYPAVALSHALAKGDLSGKKDTPADKYHLVNFDYLSSCTDLVSAVIKDIIDG